MIKSFDKYSIRHSKDPDIFLNQVNIAISENFSHPYFNVISSKYDLGEAIDDMPTILTDSFAYDYQAINESRTFTYNSANSPVENDVFEHYSGIGYSPKRVHSIKDVKKLNFPIKATNKTGSDEYKTIGKLKNCNSVYQHFTERPVPKTAFKILSFKGEPVSIVEWINRFPLDVDLDSFKYLEESKKISREAYNKFGIDLCNISILESNKGKIYVKSVDKIFNLNPHQAKIVYESIYEDYYQSRIPNFVKNKLLKEHVKPYYKKKYYDSRLIRSNHAIDYSKHL